MKPLALLHARLFEANGDKERLRQRVERLEDELAGVLSQRAYCALCGDPAYRGSPYCIAHVDLLGDVAA